MPPALLMDGLLLGACGTNSVNYELPLIDIDIVQGLKDMGF